MRTAILFVAISLAAGKIEDAENFATLVTLFFILFLIMDVIELANKILGKP